MPSIVGRWETSDYKDDTEETPPDPRWKPAWIEFYDAGCFRSVVPWMDPSALDGDWKMDSVERITLHPDDAWESRPIKFRCDLRLVEDVIYVDRWIMTRLTSLGPFKRTPKSHR